MKSKTNIFVKIFGIFQQMGTALMFPIAVLPAAGLMMGLGFLFQNATLVNALPIFGGAFFVGLSNLLIALSGIIFGNLPILFAVGVAAGLSDNDAAAALAAVIGMLITHTTINFVLGITPEMVVENSAIYTSILGINSLQMGPFGGMIVGYIASLVYRKFRNVKLPDVLAFFSGKRCVPIMMSVASVIMGVIFAYVWPYVQMGIAALGNMFYAGGGPNYFGIFIIGFLINFLLLFGLHHTVYPLFYYQLGTYTTIAGLTVIGDVNIYFSQLADGLVPTAGLFLLPAFVQDIFILPAICLAIYHVAKPERKTEVKSAMMANGITVFLTGITEPTEFSFAFQAFPLYIIAKIIIAGAGTLLAMLGMRGGSTFCAGLIDFTLSVIIPGAPRWILIIPVGLACAVATYFIAKFMIVKFDYQVFGRENDVVEDKHMLVDSEITEEMAETMIEMFGGRENIVKVNACITRLRIDVYDKTKVQVDRIKELGAKDVIFVGGTAQAIFGKMAEKYRVKMINVLEK